MKVYPSDEDYRFIDPRYSDEYFKIVDQKDFEDSMESLDQMVEEGETTLID